MWVEGLKKLVKILSEIISDPFLDQTRNLQYPEVREVSPLSQERLANKHVHAHYTATEHYSCLADISSHFAPPKMQ